MTLENNSLLKCRQLIVITRFKMSFCYLFNIFQNNYNFTVNYLTLYPYVLLIFIIISFII